MRRATLRHLVAATVSVAWPPVAAAVTYLVLVVVAIVTDEGLGGPLALPAMVVAALAFAVATTFLVVLPSVAAAEALAAGRGWHLFWQIPLAILIAGTLWLGWAALASLLADLRETGVVRVATAGFALTLVPLGVYWWTARCADWVLLLLQRLWGRLRARRASRAGTAGTGDAGHQSRGAPQ